MRAKKHDWLLMKLSLPSFPLAYQEWVKQLEQKWQAWLIPDPQAVAVIVLNQHGEVLLQLRDNNPNIAFANFWTLPGGVVEANETTEEEARRELAEETGLVLVLSHWKVYRRESRNRKFLIEQHIYAGQTTQGISEMVLGEGQALQFFKQEEFSGLSIAYDFDKLLVEFFSQREAGWQSAQRASDPWWRVPGPWWWESARFQAASVA